MDNLLSVCRPFVHDMSSVYSLGFLYMDFLTFGQISEHSETSKSN